MWADMAQGGIISPIPFSLHVEMPLPSRHIELYLYMDDTIVIATSSHCSSDTWRYISMA